LYFFYDQSGSPYALLYNGTTYYYILNGQGDVVRLVDSTGAVVASYEYNPYGKILSATGSMAQVNPLRYRGYYYDSETGFYYVNSRYYDPGMGRWINGDNQISGIGGDIRGYNLFAYCFNNPVNMSDLMGQWPKWLSGAFNIVGGVLQVAAGGALGVAIGWTGVGVVPAGFLIVNGAATTTQGIGQIVNDVADSNVLREDNIIRTSVKETGRAIGGDVGAQVAGGAYDVATVAANIYAGRVGLQQAGVAPIKVNVNQLVNNPADEFVTLGPANGVINQYCQTIPNSGYGKIYATRLENGLYQIANGHHRVAALRILGVETINIYLTK